MADILIKNMEMPKSCEDCWMTYEGDSDNCPVVNESVAKYMVEEKRHPSCPLILVPEHGDLIDRDALKENAKWIQRNDTGFFIDSMSYGEALSRAVDDAEVVLERTT